MTALSAILICTNRCTTSYIEMEKIHLEIREIIQGVHENARKRMYLKSITLPTQHHTGVLNPFSENNIT